MTVKTEVQTPKIQEEELSLERIESLVERRPGWCISIYSPTHRAGQDIRQDPIRLKNRLSEAQTQLEAAGVDEDDIHKLIRHARELCDFETDERRQFWQNQRDCLALFISPDGTEFYRLPQSFDELTVVAKRFHVKPLMQAIQQIGKYSVIAVSRNKVRFLDGNRTGLSETPVQDLPESMRAVVGEDDEKPFNLHSLRTRPSATHQTAVPHGHAETGDEHDRKRYFKVIAEALSDVLEDRTRPLIFAGVADLLPDFQDANTYEHLVEQTVAGNPDDLSPTDLHEKAWPLAEEVWRERNAQELERFQEVAHTDLGDENLEDILLAAGDGRIDTLLLVEGKNCWGTLDQEAREVSIQEESTAENYDLLDVAAVRTLRAGGKVVTLEATENPDHPAKAIYRYPLS